MYTAYDVAGVNPFIVKPEPEPAPNGANEPSGGGVGLPVTGVCVKTSEPIKAPSPSVHPTFIVPPPVLVKIDRLVGALQAPSPGVGLHVGPILLL